MKRFDVGMKSRIEVVGTAQSEKRENGPLRLAQGEMPLTQLDRTDLRCPRTVI